MPRTRGRFLLGNTAASSGNMLKRKQMEWKRQQQKKLQQYKANREYVINYRPTENEKKNEYFIINNNLYGGSYKWQKDIEEYISLIRVFDSTIFAKILAQHNNPKSIVLLINSFINTDFTIEKLLLLYNRYKFKIILPIHDWYWLVQGNKFSTSVHSIYLNDNLTLNKNAIKLFDVCSKIICPSNFAHSIIYRLYPHKKVEVCNWIDYMLHEQVQPSVILNKNGRVNIGVLVNADPYKGIDLVRALFNTYQRYPDINFCIVDVNIERYKDNYTSFIDLIRKYNIQGLMYLNKWGETWCYGLSKGLLSGLPILYNNIGAFKERIPKDDPKYIINNTSEDEFFDYEMLKTNFMKFVNYIKTHEIRINTQIVNTSGVKLIEAIRI